MLLWVVGGQGIEIPSRLPAADIFQNQEEAKGNSDAVHGIKIVPPPVEKRWDYFPVSSKPKRLGANRGWRHGGANRMRQSLIYFTGPGLSTIKWNGAVAVFIVSAGFDGLA